MAKSNFSTACVSLVALTIGCCYCCTAARSQTLEWIDQFGTDGIEWARDVSLDGLGSIYVTGQTGAGNLGTYPLGASLFGHADVYLRKYDANGTPLWIQQIGSSDFEIGEEVSADSLGNVFIVGAMESSFAGMTEHDPDARDAFLLKYDAGGNLDWAVSRDAEFRDVAADGLGNVFISGAEGGGAFVSK
jgi:hypothetical protein